MSLRYQSTVPGESGWSVPAFGDANALAAGCGIWPGNLSRRLTDGRTRVTFGELWRFNQP